MYIYVIELFSSFKIKLCSDAHAWHTRSHESFPANGRYLVEDTTMGHNVHKQIEKCGCRVSLVHNTCDASLDALT